MGRPRHGRVGAERPGFCGAKDQALAGPGTPVADELAWEDREKNHFEFFMTIVSCQTLKP